MAERLRVIDSDLKPQSDLDPEPKSSNHQMIGIEIVLMVTLCWLAAATFRPVFSHWRTFAAPTAAATVLAALGALVSVRRGIPPRISLLLSTVAACIFVSYTVLVGVLSFGVVPGQDTFSGLRNSVGQGFSDMLANTLPLSNHTLALGFVTLLTWVATAVGVETARRSTVPMLPLIAPLVVVAVAMPVLASTHPPSVWHVTAIIIVALGIVLLRAIPDPRATGTVIGNQSEELTEFHSRSLTSSSVGLGLPLLALCALIAPIAANVITRSDPFDPRDLRDEIVSDLRLNDPLGQYKRIVNQEPRPAFRINLVGADPVDVKRAAVVRLDTYDGTRWTSSDRYATDGPALSTTTAAAPTSKQVVAQLRDISLDDPWLPTIGTPTRIDLRGAGFDAQSGDLLAPGSVNGLSYELNASVFDPSTTDLAAARADISDAAAPYIALPGGMPPAIGSFATEATAGAQNAPEALDLLSEVMRNEFTVDPESAPGHSAGRLEEFLLTTKRGSAEQFAASFAVMVRNLGFPARVVVGYKLVSDIPATDDTPAQTVGLEFVNTDSYHAWVEVRFETLGWVVYDPTPGAGEGVAEQPEPASTAPTATIAPTPGGQGEARVVGPSEADEATNATSGIWRTVGVVALILFGWLALVALVVGGIIGWKAIRRTRRRRATQPADQVVGAWQEVVDRLIELGFPVTVSMTPRDVAQATRAAYGTAATLPLAFLVPDVNRAVYGRRAPDAAMVDRSWLRAAEFEQNLAITLNRRQRWAARLSLRPMRSRWIDQEDAPDEAANDLAVASTT